jgi:hypothetical protein
MKRTLLPAIAALLVLVGVIYFFSSRSMVVDPAMASSFNYLSSHGNSTCSQQFMDSISSMPDSNKLQGSCCSPMVLDKYVERVNGLKKYKTVSQIPADPYNISAKQAKELLGYDKSVLLTTAQKQTLNQGAKNSDEHGYCCCQCWRWYVYEGLSKYLVAEKHFTAQQVTEVLNDSDGCGGNS